MQGVHVRPRHQHNTTVDMTKGSITKNLLTFAIPFALTGILQLLFNAADMVIIGQFSNDSSNAVGAIGSTSSLISLFVNFFMGLSVGATVVVGRYFGARKDKELSETLHTAILVSVISGLILTLVGILLADVMLTLMNSQPQHFELSSRYVKIYFAGITSTMVYNFGSAILRAVGDTKRPLLFLSIAGVINVVLNIFFVSVCKMSVEGVAIATVISQTVAAVIVLWFLTKQTGALKLSLKKLRITKDKVSEIIRLGVPTGLQSAMFSVSNIVIQSSINGFGEITVNGHAAASSIEGFVYVTMNSFHHASISFTAQNIGAGDSERVKRAVITAPICATVVGLVVGALAYIFGEPLLKLYITDSNPALESQTIVAGLERLSVICVSYFLCGIMDSLSGIMRGAGFALAPTLINVIGICGIRILWIFTIFQLPNYHTIKTLLMSYPITWIIVLIALLVLYFTVARKSIKTQCEKNKQELLIRETN